MNVDQVINRHKEELEKLPLQYKFHRIKRLQLDPDLYLTKLE